MVPLHGRMLPEMTQRITTIHHLAIETDPYSRSYLMATTWQKACACPSTRRGL
jgi:hypothetical protein